MQRSLRIPMLALLAMLQSLTLVSSFVLHNSPLHSFATRTMPSSFSHNHAIRIARPGRTHTTMLASQPLPQNRLSLPKRQTSLHMSSSSSSSLGNRRFPSPSWQVTALCVVGVLLSLYALRVESLAKASQDFKAACDLGSWASCTRVSRSVYGTGLGLIDPRGPLGFLAWSNALYGLLYYLALLLLQAPPLFPLFKSRALAVLAAGGSFLTSVYLAIVLFAVIKDLCIVCVACYAVNAALFFFVLRDYKSVVSAIRGRG